MTPAIAKVTWAGDTDIIEAMWNKNVATRSASDPTYLEEDLGETVRDGRLYAAVGNPRGLFLVKGKRCELRAGTPGMVEVWLGRVPKPKPQPQPR